MGENTKISWAHHTHNPWWGCEKVSPACAHCYAETFSNRFFDNLWGPGSDRRFFGEKHWNDPMRWNKAAALEGTRKRVFCASMADVFEDRRDLDPWREKLWKVIAETPWLDWLLLTKRPQMMTTLTPKSWANEWPLNVWAGTTVENQEWADKRIPILLNVPARIKFLSVEPLLGPIDFDAVPVIGHAEGCLIYENGINWVIAGAESGHGARTMSMDWVRSVRDQSVAAGVAFFLKQFVAEGGMEKWETPELDGRKWTEIPASPMKVG